MSVSEFTLWELGPHTRWIFHHSTKTSERMLSDKRKTRLIIDGTVYMCVCLVSSSSKFTK